MPHTRVSRCQLARFLAFLLVPFLVGGLVACAPPWRLVWRKAPPHPLADQRPALRPAFVTDLDDPALQDAPRYQLQLDVDLTQRVITGTAQITVTNRTENSWSNVALRLYPNLTHYGGGDSFDVLSVTWQGEPLGFGVTETGTAILVDTPTLILPGERIALKVVYTLRYPRHEQNGYWLFGEYAGVVNLPLAYPVLALSSRDGSWNLSDGIPLGDTLAAASALYHVRVTLPMTTTLVSSGIISATFPQTETQRIVYELVSGPAREFTLVVGDFRVREVKIDGVRVRVFVLPEDEDMAEIALRYAAAVFQVYQRHFGPYPFAKLDVVEAPLLNRGMEYSTLNQIGMDLFKAERSKLEFLIAHEIGHQWWYNLVGNDQVGEPWLDEGLTEYSTYFYYEDVYGRARAEVLRKRRWEIPLTYVQQRGLDAPLGQPASAYSRENYETIVYAKGALFFHALRERLGDRVFEKGLREYLRAYRYRVATSHDLQRVFEAVSGMSLDEMFMDWVYGGG